MARILRMLLVVAVPAFSAACDSGPSGPGALEGRVSAPQLGAVLLEVQGGGINGFEGRAGTRVYSSALAGRPGVYRVIVLDRVGGELGFAIDVDDLGMEGPVVTVIQAADTGNDPMSVGGVSVSLVR
jgi:hypothetical protein